MTTDLRARLADARLYLCTDARRSQGDLPRFLDAVLGAGVDIVQLREKGLEAGEELALLEVFADACRRHGRLLAVNDRADVALAAGADVLHLGQDDLPVPVARRILGPGPLIGRSSHSPAQADAVAAEPGVDYFCAGPVWATPTKPGRPATGPGLLAHVAQTRPARPWFAIGGISLDRLDDVLAAGATRVVVVRAITEADDPAAATRAFTGACVCTSGPRSCNDKQMRIVSVESTDLFVGTAQRPLQVVRVTLVNEEPGAASARLGVQGAGVRDPGPFGINDLNPGEEKAFEVPVEIAAPYQPGSTRRVTVTLESEAGRGCGPAGRTSPWPNRAGPCGWSATSTTTRCGGTPRASSPRPGSACRTRTASCRTSGARSSWSARTWTRPGGTPTTSSCWPRSTTSSRTSTPSRRTGQDLRRLMAEGRVEIVGGNYNEPNTNLISAEAIIRNAVYGIGFQRDVFGGDPRSAWMLDAFGHDPGYPGLMAAAGLTSSAWARGPFHQWGPSGAEGGDRRMQFGTEFEWISPDGHGLLTAYMAHHYGAGWRLHTLPDLQAAELEAYGQFRGLAQVATTRNVLLPVGADHVIPARWVTDIHRDWNQRYVWPRFTTAVPREFFDAVRAEASSGGHAGAWITPQTRDMNPVYTGKDVSYIDTKQAQRAIETAVTEAERLGTLAWLAGAPYPHAALDKAWRLLAYGAHHDAITGVESDQVYLDLLGGWREAWELSSAARRDAVAYLAGGYGAAVGPDGVSRQRAGAAAGRDGAGHGAGARGRHPLAGGPGRFRGAGAVGGRGGPAAAGRVAGRGDADVPGPRRARARAADLPAAGRRRPRPREWREAAGTAIENAAYRGHRGSRAGRDGQHHRQAHRHRRARRARQRTGDPGRVRAAPQARRGSVAPVAQGAGDGILVADGAGCGPERCETGSRLVASFTLDGLEVTQETLLWDDAERVEFRTHVDSYRGRDRLLRVRFPADVPGGLPVYQTATAVIGRSFGVVDVDSADHWYTLDNPAHQWFGLGSTARVRTGDPRGLTQAIGVAEVVCPLLPNDLRDTLRELLVALAAAGVTATCSQADGSRYGAIDADSNLPDVRIAVGGPEVNPFTAEVLAAAGPGYAKALAARLDAGSGTARLWVPAARDRADAFGPDADVRGAGDLPVLIVAGAGPGELAAAVTALAGDLADAVVDAGDLADAGSWADAGSRADAGSGAGDGDRPVPLADRSVAVLNRGTPGCVVTPDGTLHMSLMRSCSAWPSGIWIDGDRRTAPDGSSFAWQHWSHTFEYALASGPGDWRTAGFNLIAEDYNHDLIAVTGGAGPQAPASRAPGCRWNRPRSRSAR